MTAADLDLMGTQQLVATLAYDHRRAADAVCAAEAAIAEAVDRAAPRLAAGGRLVYCGAGTSGRLGQLDAVELTPTFSWPASRAICVMAGGPSALTGAVEDAEDDREAGAHEMQRLDVGVNDVVICIAASGKTPFTLGALHAARQLGALTIGVTNHPDTPLQTEADLAICLDTGAEALLGSTRLKAGSAQKAALNTLSTALMVRLNKVYGNLMVELKPTNAKLRARAVSLVTQVSGCSSDAARAALESCGWRVKQAILMERLGLSREGADERIERAQGSLRKALAE